MDRDQGWAKIGSLSVLSSTEQKWPLNAAAWFVQQEAKGYIDISKNTDTTIRSRLTAFYLVPVT